jgi:hypothetical protein
VFRVSSLRSGLEDTCVSRGGTLTDGGFDLEIDGFHVDSTARRFVVSTEHAYATLVGLGEVKTGLPGLRKRGLIADSPRVILRDRRALHNQSGT